MNIELSQHVRAFDEPINLNKSMHFDKHKFICMWAGCVIDSYNDWKQLKNAID